MLLENAQHYKERPKTFEAKTVSFAATRSGAPKQARLLRAITLCKFLVTELQSMEGKNFLYGYVPPKKLTRFIFDLQRFDGEETNSGDWTLSKTESGGLSFTRGSDSFTISANNNAYILGSASFTANNFIQVNENIELGSASYLAIGSNSTANISIKAGVSLARDGYTLGSNSVVVSVGSGGTFGLSGAGSLIGDIRLDNTATLKVTDSITIYGDLLLNSITGGGVSGLSGRVTLAEGVSFAGLNNDSIGKLIAYQKEDSDDFYHVALEGWQSYGNDPNKFRYLSPNATPTTIIVGSFPISLGGFSSTPTDVAFGTLNATHGFILVDKDKNPFAANKTPEGGKHDSTINYEVALVNYASGTEENKKSATVSLVGSDYGNSAYSITSAIFGGESANVTAVSASAGTSSIYIKGSDVLKFITGGSGSDILEAGNSSSTLNGGLSGNDTLVGGDGSDLFIYGGGADSIVGFKSNDSISLASNVSLNFAGSAVGVSGKDLVIALSGEGNSLTFVGGSTSVFSIEQGASIYTYSAQSVTSAQTSVNDVIEKVILTSNYSASSFSVADYEKTFNSIDASEVKQKTNKVFAIYGNSSSLSNFIIGSASNANSIFGGTGSDSIVLGVGSYSDTVVYSGGADSIGGFSGKDDKIIWSLQGINPTTNTESIKGDENNFIIHFGGDSKLTFAGTTDSVVSIHSGDNVYRYDPNSVLFIGNAGKTGETSETRRITLGAGFGASFIATLDAITKTYGTSVASIDASAVTLDRDTVLTIQAANIASSIVGSNNVSTSILGSDNNDTLVAGTIGGILNGGGGSDTFIYNGGVVSIQGYSAAESGDKDIISLMGGFSASLSTDPGLIAAVTVSGSDSSAFALKFNDKDILAFTGLSTAKKDVSITGGDSTYVFSKNYVMLNDAVWLTSLVSGSFSAAEVNNETLASINAENVGKAISILGGASTQYMILGSHSGTLNGASSEVDSLTLIGGSKNDSLIGRDNKIDIFVYNGGSDSISGYSSIDSVRLDTEFASLLSTDPNQIASIANEETSTDGFVLKLKDDNKITFMDLGTEHKDVSIKGSSDSIYVFSKNYVMLGDALSLTSFVGGSFSAAASVNNTNLASIDATAVNSAISILGGASTRYMILGASSGTLDGSKSEVGVSLLGGTGADTLIGGTKNDSMFGGGGKDVFVYNGGNDYIADYNSSEGDIISLAGISFVLDTDSILSATTGNNFSLHFGSGSSLLINVSNADFKGVSVYGGGTSIGGTPDYVYTKNSIMLGSGSGISLGKNFGSVFDLTTATTGNNSTFAPYAPYKDEIVSINAEKVTASGGILIKGIGSTSTGYYIVGSNNVANTLIGSSLAADTLFGGSQADVFVYTGGMDSIVNFKQGDIVSLTGELTRKFVTSTDKVGSLASGNGFSLQFGGTSVLSFTFEESYEKQEVSIYSGTIDNRDNIYVYHKDWIMHDTGISLGAGFSSTFDSSITDNYYSLTTIDASSVTTASGISIKGNDNGNFIIGSNSVAISVGTGAGADTIKAGTKPITIYDYIKSGTTSNFGAEDIISLGGNSALFSYEGGQDSIFGYGENDSIQLSKQRLFTTNTSGIDSIDTTDPRDFILKFGGTGFNNLTFANFGEGASVVSVTSNNTSESNKGTYYYSRNFILHSLEGAGNEYEIALSRFQTTGFDASVEKQLYSNVASIYAVDVTSSIAVIGGTSTKYIQGSDVGGTLDGNASTVTGNLTLIGGIGNDSLRGRDDKVDIFVYNGGKDSIHNYSLASDGKADSVIVEGDFKLTTDLSILNSIAKGNSDTNISDNAFVLKFDNVNSIAFTSLGSDNKGVSIKSGDQTYVYTRNSIMLDSKISLKSYDDDTSFASLSAAETPYDKLTYIDASAVSLAKGNTFSIIGGSASSTIIGTKGADSIQGGSGENAINSIFGGDGNDTLVAGSNGDILIGGLGNKVYTNNTDDDLLIGGSGADTFVYSGGKDTIHGYSVVSSSEDIVIVKGNYTTFTLPTAESKISSASVDGDPNAFILNLDNSGASGRGYENPHNTITFTGLKNNKGVSIASGNDTYIYTRDYIRFKNDIYIARYATSLDGTGLGESLSINAAAATIGVSIGNLDGGNNSIFGSDKGTSVYGGSSDDTFFGGTGNDSFYGNGGADVFYFNGGNDSIGGFGSDDKIILSASINAITDTASISARNEDEEDGTFILDFGDKGSITFTDFASGGGSAVSVYSSADAENPYVYRRHSIIHGITEGSDTKATTKYGITLGAGVGNFIATDSSYANLTTIDASAVTTSSNHVVIGGNSSANYIIGSSVASASLYGGDGDDTLIAGEKGGTLDGGNGNDLLIGGASSDTFLYDAGNDTISGYGTGDIVSLTGNEANVPLITDPEKIDGDSGRFTFKFGSSGYNLTFTNLAEGTKAVSVLSTANNATYAYTHNSILLNGESISLKSSYGSKFEANNSSLPNYSAGLKFIDASRVTNSDGITIYNNNSLETGVANSVIGSSVVSNTFYTSKGNDSVKFGAGKDTFYFSGGSDSISGYRENDIIILDSILPLTDAESIATENNKFILGFDASTSLTFNDIDRDNFDDFIVSIKSGDHTYVYDKNSILYDMTSVTLKSNYGDSLDATQGVPDRHNETHFKYNYGDNLVSINAANVTVSQGAFSIIGNDLSNYIIGSDSTVTSIFGGAGNDTIKAGSKGGSIDGGAGNDLLIGNDGKDLFIYSGGFDTIHNYGTGDSISIASEDGIITDTSKITVDSKGNLIFSFNDNNALTIEGVGSVGTVLAVSLKAGFNSADSYFYSAQSIVSDNETEKSVTLTAGYKDSTFYNNAHQFASVDASAVTGSNKDIFIINGNDATTTEHIIGSDNVKTSIVGNKGNDTLIAGAAGASLYGGEGSDLLVGSSNSLASDVFIYDVNGIDSISGSGYDREKDTIKLLNTSITPPIDPDKISIVDNGSAFSLTFSENSNALVFTDLGSTASDFAFDILSGNDTYSYTSTDVLHTFFTTKNEKRQSISLGANYGVSLGHNNTFDATADTTAYSNLYSIDASKVSVANGSSAFTVISNKYDNYITGSNSVKTYIDGGAGNDTIKAGSQGGSIDGGAGNDLLVGNSETVANVFIFSGGFDTIRDFNSASDSIGFAGNYEPITDGSKISIDEESSESSPLYFTFDRYNKLTIEKAATSTVSASIQTAVGTDTYTKYYTYSAHSITAEEIRTYTVDGEYDDSPSLLKSDDPIKKVILTSAYDKASFDVNNREKIFDVIDVSAVTYPVDKGGDLYDPNKLYIFTVTGGASNESIYGSNINVTEIQGGGGSNTLIAGKVGAILGGNSSGNDLLVGGAGNDTFVFSGGSDSISNYNRENDIVSLAGGISALTNADSVETSGGNMILHFDNNNVLTVTNVPTNGEVSIQVANTTTNSIDTYSYTSRAIVQNDKSITLSSNFGNSFNANTDAYSNLVSINAEVAGGNNSFNITGNDEDNYIVASRNGGSVKGGNGNDTIDASTARATTDSPYKIIIDGGDGNDLLIGGTSFVGDSTASLYSYTFVYSGGVDSIQNFREGDHINVSGLKIADLAVSTVNGGGTSSKDLVLSFGTDSLRIINYKGNTNDAGKLITARISGKDYSVSDGQIANENGITLTSDYSDGGTDSILAYTADDNYVTINASAIGNANTVASLVANSLNNSIIANRYGGTINAGDGNDRIRLDDRTSEASYTIEYTGGKDVVYNFNALKDKVRIAKDTLDVTSAQLSSKRVVFTFDTTKNTLTLRSEDSLNAVSLVDADGKSKGVLTSSGVVKDNELTLLKSARGKIDLTAYPFADESIKSVNATSVTDQSVTLVGSSIGGTFTFAEKNKKKDGFVYGGGSVTINNYEAGIDKIDLGDSGTLSSFKVDTETGGVAITVTGYNTDGENNDGSTISLVGAAQEYVVMHSATTGKGFKKFVFYDDGVLHDKDKRATSATIVAAVPDNDAADKDSNKPYIAGTNSLVKNIVVGAGVDNISIAAGDKVKTTLNASVAGNSDDDDNKGVTLIGGVQNDKFIGSSGKDVFVYKATNGKAGKDTIQNYEAGDVISLGAGVGLEDITKISTSSTSIKLSFRSTSNTLTIKKARGVPSIYIQDSDHAAYYNFKRNQIINSDSEDTLGTDEKTATLTSGASGTFKTKKDVLYSIDGSRVTNSLKLTGTTDNDTLIGGTNKTVFRSGGGYDTFYGGTGKDTFVYNKGENGEVSIRNFNFANDKLKIANKTILAIETVSGGSEEPTKIQFSMGKSTRSTDPIDSFKIDSYANKDNADITNDVDIMRDVVIHANNTYYWFATEDYTQDDEDGNRETVASVGDLITWNGTVTRSAITSMNKDVNSIIELEYSTNLVKTGVAVAVQRNRTNT